MAAPKGNKFWLLRSKHGRDMLFESPQLLWEAACEYFEWCEKHPLYESRPFAHLGNIKIKKVAKMRAMTLSGLCFYLNCSESYFRTFKITTGSDRQDFLTVISEIESAIYNQKFQGAAADLLNANIIARDLGLTDKRELSANVNLKDNPIVFE